MASTDARSESIKSAPMAAAARRGGVARLLDRGWRISRCAVAYLTFAAAVLAVSHVVVPLLRRRGSAADLDRRAQRALHRAARLVVRVVVGLRIVRSQQSGTERLRAQGPLLVVANHPSLFDTPSLIAIMPEVDFVVEKSWADSPLVRGAVSACGYLRNDAGPALVRQSVEHLRAGRRLVIFPEGSRSPAGGLHPFHRGAARIALESGCDLLPVVIELDPPIGVKGVPWYAVPDRQSRFCMRVLSPLRPADHLEGAESRAVAARKVTNALRELYLRELNHADA